MNCVARKLLIVTIIISATSLFLFASSAYARPKSESTGETLNYSWASNRMEGALWGMASGDIDGTGQEKVILLERKKLRIGRLGAKGFESVAACELPGDVEAARVYLIDLDGEGPLEIVVSAVEQGMPSSLVLSYKDGKCRTLIEGARWSLRVIESGGSKTLIGQGWSSQAFLSGAVYELKYEKGRLKADNKIALPKGVSLYQFTTLPQGQDGQAVAVIKGYAPLEVYEMPGKKFKRSWRTGERFGGSVNLLQARQRDLLGEVRSDLVSFDPSPLLFEGGVADYLVVAPRHDLPLKGMIGRRPLVHGSQIGFFKSDPALYYSEIKRSPNLPGAIADCVIGDPRGEGSRNLFVLMQDNPGMFKEGDRSVILEFDLR